MSSGSLTSRRYTLSGRRETLIVLPKATSSIVGLGMCADCAITCGANVNVNNALAATTLLIIERVIIFSSINSAPFAVVCLGNAQERRRRVRPAVRVQQ